MSDRNDIGATLGLDISTYTRNMQKAIRDADDADTALDALVKQANAAEKALNQIGGDVEVRLDADFSALLEADKTLQSLDTTISPLVDVQIANDATARALLEDFNSSYSPKLDVETSELLQAEDLLRRLDAESVTVKVNADDSEVDTAQRKVEAIDGETIDTKVNADDSELKGIREQLEMLQKLAVIDIVMNLPEMLPGAEDIPLLGTIADQDKARRAIAAGTGGDAALTQQYAAGAESVFTSNFGADRQEAAQGYLEVVRQTKDETGKLATTGEDFTQITKDGFATAAQSGEDFNAVIAAADTLVQTGLAPTYSDAFDMINTGFQEGLNKGDDFLDTIKEYSGQFADLGFSADEFFSTLKGGLEAGAFNTDFVADLVKEFNIRAQAAMDSSSTEFDFFKAAGLKDELKAFKAGEITGKEFFSGAVQAVTSGTLNPQQVFDIMGTKAEDLTLDAVIKLDPAQIDEEIAKYSGTTLEVSAALGGDLDSSIETAKRAIESELATSVSNAFDIPGKIQQFSDGVSKMSELINAGATIPEAIEVAFQLPGFAETADILASAMGNLGIVFMQLVASVLEGIGKADAANTVRGTIAQASEAQLAFDLKLANDGGDFANAVKIAAERGVADADIQAAIQTAGAELIAQGDTDAAQDFLTVLQDMATVELSPALANFLSGKGVDTTNLQQVKDALATFTAKPGQDVGAFGTFADYQRSFEEAQAAIGEIDFAETAQAALLPLQSEFDKAQFAVDGAFEAMLDSSGLKMPLLAENVSASIGPVNEEISTLQTGFMAADNALALLGTNSGVNIETLSANLSTGTANVDDFTSNADYQFTDVFGLAVEGADLVMETFGLTVTDVMLGASEQVDLFIEKLKSIGAVDVSVPTPGIGGSSGGEGAGGSFAVGGQIPAGEVGRVHAEELLYAGPHDVSVLNRQTSSVLDAAVAAYLGGAGMGGGGNTTINQYNNIVFNTQGAAATQSALGSVNAIRGF